MLVVLWFFASLAVAQQTRPNVIVILVDDVGFSDVGCYGGEIHTPNVDRLAANGMRMTQFYNCARCCPSRAALLTGLYPTQTGMGAMNQDLGHEEYEGFINTKCVTTAEALKEAGYHTGMVGKWHLTHLTIASGGDRSKRLLNFEEEGPISPGKNNWPVSRGFEEHWGTIPGVDSYYDPYGLVHNLEVIKPDKPDFYYTDFITDHAVGLIDQFTADKAKPFYMYVAYTAAHWPMQAREADIEKYKDTYTVGWDAIREKRFAKQVELGIVKKEWGLSPRSDYKALNEGPSEQCPWEEAPDKPWQARRMAVYAAMIDCMDRGVGRIMEELRVKGVDDNTVVMFLSDNGGCAENVEPGWYDIPSKTRDGRKIEVGNNPKFMPGPETVYQSYGPAWANVSDTPFRRFKHWTEEGGISAPFIVHWPGVTTAGRVEHDQVGHVIDLMPTILDLAGAKYPATYNGHEITPVEGKSLTGVFKGQPLDRGPLCWEHEGNRAVRVGQWKLVAAHNEQWQLYDVVNDRPELHDLASSEPAKVEELKKVYAEWATRIGVRDWPIRK